MWKPLFALFARAFAAGAASFTMSTPLGATVVPVRTTRRTRSASRVLTVTTRATPRALAADGRLHA